MNKNTPQSAVPTINRIKRFESQAIAWIDRFVYNVGHEVFAWLAVILLHSATIPALLALLSGLSDRMLPVEMVLMVWAGLAMLFLQAVVQRNMLLVITIAAGFILQDVLLALIFFK